MIHQKIGRLARPGAVLCLCFVMKACGGGGDAEEAVTPDVRPVVAAAIPVTPVVTAQVSLRPNHDPVQESVPVIVPPGAEVAAPSLIAETSCGLNGTQGIQAELLLTINAVRAAGAVCGTSVYRATRGLNWNNMLQQSAAEHSRDMAQNHVFSHVSTDGRTLMQRIQATGYSLSAAGENIAAGQGSVQEVVASWLNSPGHCKNMMEPSYQDIGVACIRNDGAPYGMYWTMNLARP
jgi:uncharacterized protein YkwD